MKRLLFLILCALLVCGCKTGVLKDPNDPSEAGALAPDVLRRNLQGVSDMLNDRLASGEISEQEYRSLIEDAAQEFLKKVDVEHIDPSRAWEYVEVLRTAKRWPDTLRFARLAVKDAQKKKNPDRLVNDTLRLAQALGETGHVKEAIATARQVFNAGPTDSGPILPATLYEIVPSLRGKGHDEEVAKLLEDAIGCHMRTVVDPNEPHGRDFLLARPAHVSKAWRTVIELYAGAGDIDQARQAARRGQQMLSSFSRA